MGPDPRPEAETVVDRALVEALVADQHPELRGPVRAVAEGWDNAVFRLGDELAVRMPRRLLGAELVAKELRWLPGLAEQLPVPVPCPVAAGAPGLGYPFPWTIVRWVPGVTALEDPGPLDQAALAEDLRGVLGALGSAAAPPDAPVNPYRGVPLVERSAAMAERLEHLPVGVDRAAVATAWERSVAAPAWTDPPVWVHGDLHPGNLVVAAGRLSGVVDWGDMAAGDPAADVAVAWMVLDPPARQVLRSALAVDDAGWARARGNALAHAVAVLVRSADDPAMAAMAHRTLAAVLADPS